MQRTTSGEKEGIMPFRTEVNKINIFHHYLCICQVQLVLQNDRTLVGVLEFTNSMIVFHSPYLLDLVYNQYLMD